MADLKISGQKIFLGGFNITGDLRSIGFGVSAADLDKTTLGCSTISRWSGLKDFRLSHEGIWQAGDTPDLIDHIMWDKYAVANEVVTVGPTTGADGELGYFLRTMYSNYEAGGSVGEIFAFNASAVASADPVVRGTIMLNGTKTVTGSGTARQLGPVMAGVPNKCTVTNATNATPIQITTSAAHGYSTGHKVDILEVGGNLAANGANRAITLVDATNFTIDGSVGSAAYTSGGYVLGPAAEYVYAALHVVAASADDTLDVIVESDDAEGFATPTTRITFTQMNAIGAQWGTPVAGSITDNWWRISFTIGGVDPSFTFVVTVGIQ